MNKRIVIGGLILFISAIILGAFGAHALRKHLNFEQLNTFEVGIRYQFYQAIALIIVGFNSDKLKFAISNFFIFSILATLLFSGSIYLLCIASIYNWNKDFIGPITPIGGLILIVNWTIFMFRIYRQ